ncbi:hypothetical protein HOD05_03085 [Candidatus Woesearchaeota archaeon]|jgi:hypothetical protein|nr:hypothetical protein [Candidatus Woesearchaeota archaeon]MBT4151358.1 hypothetical protein [Candidatus Woesearchaeota archaeon]MBT4247756.1 hypothetical protein [Candidatus Woesearchaeota archaeon]MBT4434180.1 hypothetical protein [Candidatus Woesearchaeota archaeon]MBT7332350.1 hypothetical protein [Candidatus Woesearchaeota archaeon]
MSELKQEVYKHLMFKVYFLNSGIEPTEEWEKNHFPFTYVTRQNSGLDVLTVGTELFSDVRVNNYEANVPLGQFSWDNVLCYEAFEDVEIDGEILPSGAKVPLFDEQTIRLALAPDRRLIDVTTLKFEDRGTSLLKVFLRNPGYNSNEDLIYLPRSESKEALVVPINERRERLYTLVPPSYNSDSLASLGTEIKQFELDSLVSKYAGEDDKALKLLEYAHSRNKLGLVMSLLKKGTEEKSDPTSSKLVALSSCYKALELEEPDKTTAHPVVTSLRVTGSGPRRSERAVHSDTDLSIDDLEAKLRIQFNEPAPEVTVQVGVVEED